jgi:hypothetical protein
MQPPQIIIPTGGTRPRHRATLDRIFQGLLSVVIIGVVYRYCWIGPPAISIEMSFQMQKGIFADLGLQMSQIHSNAAHFSTRVRGLIWVEDKDGAPEGPFKIGSLQVV